MNYKISMSKTHLMLGPEAFRLILGAAHPAALQLVPQDLRLVLDDVIGRFLIPELLLARRLLGFQRFNELMLKNEEYFSHKF